MSYRVAISRDAEKEFLSLPPATRARAKTRILALESEPRPAGTKKLRESDKYRLRIGDYRVVYSIDDHLQEVVVLSIGHRREVYR